MKKYLVIIMLMMLTSCIGKATSDKEIYGLWKNNGESSMEFHSNGEFSGKSLPTKLFEGINLNVDEINCGGKWEIKNETIYLDIRYTDTSPISYITPMYYDRNGLLSDGEIKAIYFLSDVETESKYKFYKQLK